MKPSIIFSFSWALMLTALSCGAFSQSTSEEGAPAQADVAVQDFEVLKDIVYSKVGERELLLDAYLPKATPKLAGKHPAVLVVHGGAWRRGSRRQLRGYAEALAQRGFGCFAIDYRLAPEHKFPAQIDDCRSAVKWIRKNASKYKVDASKLGAIGYSAGGHLVTLLGTTGEAPSESNGNVDTRIQAVVAGGAPTDFRWMPDGGNWAEYWMGGNLKTAPEKFHQASSAAFVDAKDAPTFFFHGEHDLLVPMIWAGRCHNELKKAGVRTTMHKVRQSGHRQAASNKEALEKAYEFLASELKPSEQSAPAK